MKKSSNTSVLLYDKSVFDTPCYKVKEVVTQPFLIGAFAIRVSSPKFACSNNFSNLLWH